MNAAGNAAGAVDCQQDACDAQDRSSTIGPFPHLADISTTSTKTEKIAIEQRDDKVHQAHSSQLCTGRKVLSSVQVDMVKRTVKRYDWDSAALHSYRRFPKLLGERKYAQPNVNQRQNLSFLDLPGEIRNKIYNYALNFDSIELATKSRFDHKSNRARALAYRDYKQNIKPVLRLLRTNKQVNEEASSIFYGQNEFRFTAICGHDILRAFCKTIGKANTLRLAKITEHAPIEGDFEEVWDHRATYSKTSKSNFEDWLSAKGLHQQGHLAGRFPVERTITGKNGSLKEYRMVIPSTFSLGASSIVSTHRCLLHFLSIASSGVKISLVLLDMQVFYPHGGYCSQTILREQCKELAHERGWNVIKAFSDHYGRYEYPESWSDDAGCGEESTDAQDQFVEEV